MKATVAYRQQHKRWPTSDRPASWRQSCEIKTRPPVCKPDQIGPSPGCLSTIYACTGPNSRLWIASGPIRKSGQNPGSETVQHRESRGSRQTCCARYGIQVTYRAKHQQNLGTKQQILLDLRTVDDSILHVRHDICALEPDLLCQDRMTNSAALCEATNSDPREAARYEYLHDHVR